MARQPKPWYWKDRRVWCVTINGKRHNLGRHKKDAIEQFRALVQRPRRVTAAFSPLLVSIVDEFLDWVSRNRAPDTFEWYRRRLQNFIDCHPDLSVDQLKPHHVEKWAGNPTHSVTTRRNQMRSVKRCLKWAVSQGYLESSPIAHLEVPSAQGSTTYVSVEEFNHLLKLIPDQDFVDLLVISYEIGCRPQESLRVEARHVDLKHARWVFPKQEAKGQQMPRIIYLSEHVVRVSKRLMDIRQSGPLFRNNKGRPWNKDSIGCAFDRLQIRMGKAELKRLDEVIDDKSVAEFAKTLAPERLVRGVLVPKSEADLLCESRRKLTDRRARQLATRYSLYSLRHSWATNALKQGVDSLTVAILMGHKDAGRLARQTNQCQTHHGQTD